MKTMRNIFILGLLTLSLISKAGNIDLFNVISLQIPETFVKGDIKDSYVDKKEKTQITFSFTTNKQFGVLLPKVSFDFLYNTTTSDSVVIKSKSIKQIGGLKIGLVEKQVKNTITVIFFTEINNELFLGEIKGDLTNEKYLNDVSDKIVNSIKKK